MSYLNKLQQIDVQFNASKAKIIGPSEFKSILNNFSFSLEELKNDLLYPEDLPYGRNCVFSTPNFEVIVMNWKPRNESNIHDHGNSFGCVYAVDGKASNVLYDENLNKLGTVELIKNEIAEVPKGIFHQIENRNDEYAVTLHFYSPPLSGMRVIDLNDKNRSFIVKDNCGAWNPKDNEIVKVL